MKNAEVKVGKRRTRRKKKREGGHSICDEPWSPIGHKNKSKAGGGSFVSVPKRRKELRLLISTSEEGKSMRTMIGQVQLRRMIVDKPYIKK